MQTSETDSHTSLMPNVGLLCYRCCLGMIHLFAQITIWMIQLFLKKYMATKEHCSHSTIYLE